MFALLLPFALLRHVGTIAPNHLLAATGPCYALGAMKLTIRSASITAKVAKCRPAGAPAKRS